MRHMTWLSVLMAAFALLGGSQSEAGLFCGIGRYRCCPTDSCQTCQDYCQARTCNSGCYKTVRENRLVHRDVSGMPDRHGHLLHQGPCAVQPHCA